MSTDEEDGVPTSYASPPCYMHELDPDYASLAQQSDLKQDADIVRWRKAERTRLTEQRMAVPPDFRRQHDERIADHLRDVMGSLEGLVVSFYWAFRGEPNLYGMMKEVVASGGQVALPAVVARRKPLVFRSWAPGGKLDREIWNIPVPPPDAPVVIPDIAIAPVVGFDKACYRLGYGGGYFDRTLAALARSPRVIGVGYASAAVVTIYPQWHDVPMDCLVTEEDKRFAEIERHGIPVVTNRKLGGE